MNFEKDSSTEQFNRASPHVWSPWMGHTPPQQAAAASRRHQPPLPHCCRHCCQPRRHQLLLRLLPCAACGAAVSSRHAGHKVKPQALSPLLGMFVQETLSHAHCSKLPASSSLLSPPGKHSSKPPKPQKPEMSTQTRWRKTLQPRT